jgi:hypothetical protein
MREPLTAITGEVDGWRKDANQTRVLGKLSDLGGDLRETAQNPRVLALETWGLADSRPPLCFWRGSILDRILPYDGRRCSSADTGEVGFKPYPSGPPVTTI